MHRTSDAASSAARRGRKRGTPRMYYPFWKYIRDNPDQWHTLMVPADLQPRVIKALRKERWLAGPDEAHILVVQSCNSQSIRACWKTHSGLLLADIPIGMLFAAMPAPDSESTQ